MIGTAHGSVDRYLVFADTRAPHGQLPAAVTTALAITARTTIGRRSQL
jgi:hypothetical protein